MKIESVNLGLLLMKKHAHVKLLILRLLIILHQLIVKNIILLLKLALHILLIYRAIEKKQIIPVFREFNIKISKYHVQKWLKAYKEAHYLQFLYYLQLFYLFFLPEMNFPKHLENQLNIMVMIVLMMMIIIKKILKKFLSMKIMKIMLILLSIYNNIKALNWLRS